MPERLIRGSLSCGELIFGTVDQKRAIGQQMAHSASMACQTGDIHSVRIFSIGLSLAGAGLLSCIFAAATGGSGAAQHRITIAGEVAERATDASFQTFLDRLMGAESAGVDHAKNPRSTAVGPFQFIKATFLDVTRRHFPTEVAGLTDAQILRRRTERDFARRAAEAFSRDNIGHLKRQGLEPTFAQLRLAFLLGAGDAVRVVQAEPQIPVVQILSSSVIKANPFMARMTASDLLAKSERDVERARDETVAMGASQLQPRPSPRARPGIAVARRQVQARREKCNLHLASCRKFSALVAKKG
jgi:hypothetical protein